jgi:hypothetical protein
MHSSPQLCDFEAKPLQEWMRIQVFMVWLRMVNCKNFHKCKFHSHFVYYLLLESNVKTHFFYFLFHISNPLLYHTFSWFFHVFQSQTHAYIYNMDVSVCANVCTHIYNIYLHLYIYAVCWGVAEIHYALSISYHIHDL